MAYMLEKSEKKQERTLDSDPSQVIEEIKQNESLISVKIFIAKFIFYVNDANSSIQATQGVFQLTSSLQHKEHKMPTLELEKGSFGHVSVYSIVEKNQKKKKHRTKQSKPQAYKIMKNIYGKIQKRVLQGEANLEFKNGCVFKGKMGFGKIQQGELTYPNGIIYSGKFKNSLPEGPGRLLLPNGTQYITDFKGGKVVGITFITYENGDIYRGPIYKLKKHGIGKLFFKNGDKYIGDFIHGEITGMGIYYVDSKPEAAGFWRNGELIAEAQVQIHQTDTFSKSLLP